MSNKVFIAIIVSISLAVVGYAVTKRDNNPQRSSERPGVEQPDKGQKHVATDVTKYNGPEPPTSGDHSEPVPWQAYDQQVPDINIIHNLEHGGIFISYRPDLPPEQVAQIKALFTKPFSNPKFQPAEAVIAPRAANSAPIIMSSWRRNMKLETFDEAKMMEYYLRNVGKSPEALAS